MVYPHEEQLASNKGILKDRQFIYYEIFVSLAEAILGKKKIESCFEKKIRFLINFVNSLLNDWKEEINN